MTEIRILRILEYIGDEKVVWDNLKNAGVPVNGEIDFRKSGGICIKSGLIGYPDFIAERKKGEPFDELGIDRLVKGDK